MHKIYYSTGNAFADWVLNRLEERDREIEAEEDYFEEMAEDCPLCGKLTLPEEMERNERVESAYMCNDCVDKHYKGE